VWKGVEYRPLTDPGPARELFTFAAAALPAVVDADLALGAWADGARLVGAVLAERDGPSALLYGPVVVASRVESPTVGREAVRAAAAGEASLRIRDERSAPTADTTVAADDALEIAEQLVAAAIDLATARGVQTLFTRPQGLDRVWVRFGFIPVPEVGLPAGLRGRPGAGLFAYRGGSALWSLRPAAGAEPGDRAPGSPVATGSS
jgi:hypothetical protein